MVAGPLRRKIKNGSYSYWKGERKVQCVAVYTRAGLDLRLLECAEMLRTERFRLRHHHDGARMNGIRRCSKRGVSIPRARRTRGADIPKLAVDVLCPASGAGAC